MSLRPFPFQVEILDKLAAERAIHGRRRNLVVAATGTGKTVIAAFDYARQCAATGVTPRLLFLAHRKELLEQARRTFQHVLQDAAFGELFAGGVEPRRYDHVFGSIQSAAASRLIERLGAGHFRHVIVDECHHVPARSYQAVMSALQPELLVGLTATPERSDGKSLLPDFDGHIAAELRLWHALDGQLLVPFEYYGIADGVYLRRVRWSRVGYDAGALGERYTGNDARSDLIRHQLARRVGDVRAVRALGFCVSVAHAEYSASCCSSRWTSQARSSLRPRVIVTMRSARSCFTGRPRPRRACRGHPAAATSTARRTGGRSFCSCGRIRRQRLRSSVRFATRAMPEIGRSRLPGVSRRRWPRRSTRPTRRSEPERVRAHRITCVLVCP